MSQAATSHSEHAQAVPNLSQAKRAVIKVGSALLVDEQTGHIRHAWLDSLADDIAQLRSDSCDVAVVSSGAIAVGREHLGLRAGKLRLEEKQAAAATGQGRLAHAYQTSLARHDVTAAQILLTPDDTEDRRRHLNARATLEQLFALSAVPIINENDTVATDEIRFGDNDRLAARVSQMIGADVLVLLSDIDGLYTADPRRDASASHIPVVTEIDQTINAMAGPALPGHSSGGMVTKLAAASIATGSGCHLVITNGQAPNPLTPLMQNDGTQDGGPGSGRSTWFTAQQNPRTARKRWIASSLAMAGTITVDDGAARALLSGKSLLPAGVTEISGTFARGDTIEIKRTNGARLALGLTAYGSKEAKMIAGKQSRQIEQILGFAGREEMVHRDDLALEARQSKQLRNDG